MALRVRTHVRTGQAAAAQGGGGGGLILDTLGVTAKCAFSTRKLRSAYAGSALRVRRSSDNAGQDIGFDGSGNLDTAALATFIGANSGFVATWYDQSGNAADGAQGTVGNQPRLVNAGANDTMNSKPCLNFTTIGMNFGVSGPTSTLPVGGNARLINTVASVAALGTVHPFCGGSSSGVELRTTTGGAIELLSQAVASIATTSGITLSVNAQHVFETSWDRAGPYSIMVDGTSFASGSNSTNIPASDTLVVGGAPASSEWLLGLMAEFIIFDVAVTRATLEADQKTYWGTP